MTIFLVGQKYTFSRPTWCRYYCMGSVNKLDSWFLSHLRRVVAIRASYYSHLPKRTVWEQARAPTPPSQLVLRGQLRLLQSLNADQQEPLHDVAFSPALRDRISCYTHHETGPPPPHWLALTFSHAMEYSN